VEIAKKNGGQFNVSASRELWKQGIDEMLVNNVNGSLSRNPKTYLDGFGVSGGIAAVRSIKIG
jgi:hypothetical protein